MFRHEGHSRSVGVSCSLVLLLLCAACANNNAAPRNSEPQPRLSYPQLRGQEELPSLEELEQLAQATQASRSVSAVTENRLGAEFLIASPQVEVNGDLASFASAPDQLCWAVYEFSCCTSRSVKEFSYQLSNRTPGTPVWLAVSNYGLGYWEFLGPYDADTQTVDLGALSDVWSNDDHSYLALLAWDGAAWDLNTVEEHLEGEGFPGWVHTYGSPVSDFALKVAVDAQGNVYAIGREDAAETENNQSTWVMKYDPAGNLLAAREFRLGPTGEAFNSLPGGIEITATGEVYVACSQSWSPLTSALSDIVLLRLDSDLGLVWCRVWSGLDRNIGDPLLGDYKLLTIDPDGNLLLLVRCTEDGTNRWQSALVKISPEGALLDDLLFSTSAIGQRLGFQFNQTDQAQSGGRLALAGSFGDLSDSTDFAVACLEADWSLAWAKTLNFGNSESASAVSLDDSGNLTLLGGEGGIQFVELGSPNEDALRISMDATGYLLAATYYWLPGYDLSIGALTRSPAGLSSFGSISPPGEAEQTLLLDFDLSWQVTEAQLLGWKARDTAQYGDSFYSCLSATELCLDTPLISSLPSLPQSGTLGPLTMKDAPIVLEEIDATFLTVDALGAWQVADGIPDQPSSLGLDFMVLRYDPPAE